MMPSVLQLINDAIPFMYKGAKDIFLRAKVKDLNFGGILIECHDQEVGKLQKILLSPLYYKTDQ